MSVIILTPSSSQLKNTIYAYVIEQLFHSKNIDFQVTYPDTDISPLPDSTKAVIVIGDSELVLSNSFLQACQSIFGPTAENGQRPFMGPKLLISQGLPNTLSLSLIASLNMYDQISLHSQSDVEMLQEFDTNQTLKDRVQYWPDACYLLPESVGGESQKNENEKLTVGIYLPRGLSLHNPHYTRFVRSYVQELVQFQSTSGCHYQLFVIDEADNDVAQDVLFFLSEEASSDLYVTISYLQGVEDLLKCIQNEVDVVISYNYTLTLLCLISKRQVISLVPTHNEEDEIRKLAKDLELKPETLVNVSISTRYGKPESIETETLCDALTLATQQLENSTNPELPQTQEAFTDYLLKYIDATKITNGVIVGPSGGDGTDGTSGNGSDIAALSTQQIKERSSFVKEAALNFNASRSFYDPTQVALFICFLITNRSEPSKYFHGLVELLSTVDALNKLSEGVDNKLEKGIRWIIKDAFQKGLTYDYSSIPTAPAWLTSPQSVFRKQPQFSISLNSQFGQASYQGVHRSGWAYVKAGLSLLHSDDAEVFLDVYLDSSFSWQSQILLYQQLLPYKRPWIGFFHHAFSSTTESFDVQSAIRTEGFKASLSQCKCLITLSKDLKDKLIEGLESIRSEDSGVNIPPVVHLVHPTEQVPDNSLFRMDKFLANPERKLVQVGSFYRNSFAIYALPLGGQYLNSLDLQKCHLRAFDSARYFRPNNLFDHMQYLDTNTGVKAKSDDGSETHAISRSMCGVNGVGTISQPLVVSTDVTSVSRSISGVGGLDGPIDGDHITNNVYIYGMIEHVRELDETVKILEHLDNDDYDDLLAANIVFIQLTQASAINSCIECVVRNTPILVNPLPAVVELLGDHYPFYYNTLAQAAEKANDIALIAETYEYLTKLDKTDLMLDYFLNEFQAKVGPYIQATSRKRKMEFDHTVQNKRLHI